MKDAIFSGPDVASALEEASRTLGLPPGALRYVVLQEPVPGRLGLTAQPARIAILMDAGRARSAGSAPPEEIAVPDLPVQIGDLGRRLAEATGLDLSFAVADHEGRLQVRVEGAGAPAFLGDEGVQPALEHLLRRWAERAGHDLDLAGGGGGGAGHRERRDEALRQRALQLADAVRVDGQPRRLEGLNSYERRIVHVALQDAPGVETFSVGEGAGRRVVIAPRIAPLEED